MFFDVAAVDVLRLLMFADLMILKCAVGLIKEKGCYWATDLYFNFRHYLQINKHSDQATNFINGSVFFNRFLMLRLKNILKQNRLFVLCGYRYSGF